MPGYAHRRLEPQGKGCYPFSELWRGRKNGKDRRGRENRDRGTFDADPATWEGVGLLTIGLILQTFLVGSQGNSEGKKMYQNF